MTGIITFFIRLYQNCVSPFLPRSCRFVPSCSAYALEAFHIHGFFRGCVLTVWRILRCNPFLQGGYDPVPSRNRMIDVSRVNKGEYHE